MAISHAVREATDVVGTSEAAREQVLVRHRRRSYAVAKRVFDVIVSSVALIVLSPLFLIISLCVALTGGLPVLYKQPRVGKGGKTIHVLKFRTMVHNADALLEKDPELRQAYEENFKLKDDPRITKLGKILRRTTLDELPQLINVFKGDMSIVGPRPIIERELERYGDACEMYLAMTPGCAGIWQCSGRNELAYEQRVEMDVEYYWRASFFFDLSLVLRTIVAMITRHGAC